MGLIRMGKRVKKEPVYQRETQFLSVLSRGIPFAYVEAYKALRTNLEFVSSVNGVKSIVVTSALPAESKSTTAINLAATLAKGGKSVILVECDMRKPSLRKYLAVGRRQKGLSAILTANAGIEECIVEVENMGIHVIHAGAIPPNPSELLNQERMKKLIETLKERYDYVILDAPPAAVVTDAVIVGRMVDGVLLVVRSRFAPARTVRLVRQRLESVNINILGVVLTRFDEKRAGWRSGYQYGGYEYGDEQKWSKL